MKLNKKILILECFISLLVCGCQKQTKEIKVIPNKIEMEKATPTDIQSGYDFENFDNIKDVEKVVGYTPDFPVKVGNYKQDGYQVFYKNVVVQASFIDDYKTLIYRESKDFKKELLNNDYRKFDELNTETIDNKDITLLGNKGTVYVAMWNDGDFSKCVITSNGLSMNELQTFFN